MCNDVVDRSLTLSVSTGGEAVAQAPTYHVCDPKLVARALLNLIRNRTRYAKRAISLGAEVDGTGTLVLTVDDDGPGIPLADRDRVFEPFHRLDSSRDRHTGGFGLGLGLAIVRRVALVRGADVRLESAASGGARFEMTLPALRLPANATVS